MTDERNAAENPSHPLTGQTALVTGASRGIGKEIAVALARAGARVACVSTRDGGCDKTLAACREAGGMDPVAFAADVGDVASVNALAKSVQGAFDNRLDVLVNNAGITRDGVFLRMQPEDFDEVVRVNLRGAFLVTKAFMRGMAKARTGRVIHVGSIVGATGNAGQVNYAASKAGLLGLTKSLAKELGSRSVTINAVAPGFIETDMTDAIPEAGKAAMLQSIPLGRFGRTADVAAAVVYLAGPGGAYVTGQTLVVDGGLT